MKTLKHISLALKLSKLEGQKESLVGQQNLSLKLYNRGTIGEDEFLQQREKLDEELKELQSEKRSILRKYAA